MQEVHHLHREIKLLDRETAIYIIYSAISHCGNATFHSISTLASPSDHIKGDLRLATTLSALIGISWYIGIELNIRLFATFKRRRGLYFWSCCICSWGVILSPVFGGVLLDFGVVSNPWISVPFIYIAWAMMILGQSLVLYSRLHLVMNNPKHLRWILGMICLSGVGICLPTVVVGLVRLANPSLIMDRIQVTTFFLQETILSSLYVYKTRSYLKFSSVIGNNNKTIHRVM